MVTQGRRPGGLHLRCDCEVNCFDKIRSLGDAARIMSDARMQFAEAGQRGSSKMLFNMLLPMRMFVCNKIVLAYCICGIAVCADAFFQYFGLLYSDSRVKRVLASIRKGYTTWIKKTSTKTGRPNQRGMYCTAWQRQYILDYADQMPNKCVFRVDPVQLKELHEIYHRHEALFKHAALSYSRFCELWNVLFSKGISVDGIKHKIEMRPGVWSER